MKKLTLIMLLFLASFASVRAQDDDDDDTDISYRITGGVNFAFIEETPQLIDAVSSFGYMLGVAANIGENFFIQPALQYASYGSTVTLPSATEGDTKHALRVNYIRVPVQVGARLFEASSSSPLNVEVRGGLSESVRVGFNDNIKSGSGPQLSSDDIADFRTAGVVGAGVRILFFSLDVEYEFGLTDLFVDNGSTKLDALYVIFGGNF